jgi:predicted small metal-binding protein
MKHFSCDSVVPGCDAVFTGDSEREVLLQAVEHAGEEHGLDDATAQLAVQVLDKLA